MLQLMLWGVLAGAGVGHAQPIEAFPHVRVDREAGVVDVDVYVSPKRAEGIEWLELIVCTPGTREHESLVVSLANPRHIHAAVLLLGLEPGTPLRVERVEDEWVLHPPTGPEVDLFFVLPVEEGEGAQQQEVPVSQWVRERETGEALPSHRFLFAGSEVIERDGQSYFMAEVNGTIASLVQFGDELFTQSSELTNMDGSEPFDAWVERMPAARTELVLRIRPVVWPIEPEVPEPTPDTAEQDAPEPSEEETAEGG